MLWLTLKVAELDGHITDSKALRRAERKQEELRDTLSKKRLALDMYIKRRDLREGRAEEEKVWDPAQATMHGIIETLKEQIRGLEDDLDRITATVKHLSWKPPWVSAEDGDEDLAAEFLGNNVAIPDPVGLGRHPNLWWTLNCAYNYVYDIHRLNVGVE